MSDPFSYIRGGLIFFFFLFYYSQRRYHRRHAGNDGPVRVQYRRFVHRVDAVVRRVHPERAGSGQRSPDDPVEHLRERSDIFGHHVPDASFPSHPEGYTVCGADKRRNIFGRLSNSKTALEN